MSSSCRTRLSGTQYTGSRPLERPMWIMNLGGSRLGPEGPDDFSVPECQWMSLTSLTSMVKIQFSSYPPTSPILFGVLCGPPGLVLHILSEQPVSVVQTHLPMPIRAGMVPRESRSSRSASRPSLRFRNVWSRFRGDGKAGRSSSPDCLPYCRRHSRVHEPLRRLFILQQCAFTTRRVQATHRINLFQS